VAGGVAGRFDLDPAVVRILWAILILLSGGIFLLIYVVMAIVVPLEPLGALGGPGWSGAGPSGWSSSWSNGWPATGGPPSDPGVPPADTPPDPGAGAAATNPAGPGGPDPTAGAPSAPGFAAPGPSSAAFAAPPAGSWSSPGSGRPDNSGQSSRHAAREARRAARRAARGYGSDRWGAGGIVGGLILVALGAYFLIRTFAPQLEVDRYWPVGLIVLGVILVGLSIRRTPGPGAP
jgi:phage shock protein C